MALKRNERYPGRFANPSTAHPQGAFQNRTSPTSQDGSYLEADWANDIDGFFARIINIAGITLNGTVDDGTASQLYDALVTAMPGRLLGAPKVFTSNGTYTPTAGTKKIIVEMISAGGGTPAGSTTAGNSGGCQAGVHGQYNKSMFDVSTLTPTVAVSVGQAVVGNSGGNSSFGTYIVLQGGAINSSTINTSGAALLGTAYVNTGYTNTSTGQILGTSNGQAACTQVMQVTAGVATGFMPVESPFPGGYYGRGSSGTYSSGAASYAAKGGISGICVIYEYS